MSHPLSSALRGVRRRWRGVLVAYGLARWVTIVLAVAAVLALADYLLRSSDPGVRVLSTLALLGAAVWGLGRYLLAACRARLSDVAVALRVEQRFPVLRDRLSSAIEFLDGAEDDPRAGSAQLRRRVIHEVTEEIAPLRLVEAVDVRPARWALTWAAVAVAAAFALALLDPPSTRIALVRLAAPWSDVAWPRRTHLAFVDPPRRIGSGQPFVARVIDAEGRPVPDGVRIFFRHAGEPLADDDAGHPMTRAADGAFTASKPSVTRPFSYRAVGGDDDTMAWIDLEVVEPPAIERLGVTYRFPDYTGWGVRPGEPHFRVLAGTTIELAGHLTKPVSRATLTREGEADLDLTLGAEGLEFALAADAPAPFVARKSGGYTLRLVDREPPPTGAADDPTTTAAVQYRMQVIPDRPPTASLEEPQADRFVTPEAVVPLRLLAKDDLAVARIELVYSRSDQSERGEQTMVLWQGPERVAPLDPAAPLPLDGGVSQAAEQRWELKPLGLPPGTQLLVYAAASDYLPQSGRSPARRFSIVTPAELQDRLAERQSHVLGEVARLLKLQRESRAKVGEATVQRERVGHWSKADVDQLQAAELAQRQVERGLVHPADGAAGQVQSLLDELENNRLDAPDTQEQLESLLDELRRLGRDELPPTARSLTTAIKGVQTELRDGPQPAATAAVDQALAAAAAHQDEVVRSLEQMLADMSEWDNYRRVQRELAQVRQEQQELAARTAELGRQTLSRDPRDLAPQQQADLEKLASRQHDLAGQVEKLEQSLRQMSEQLEAQDPLAADTLAEAVEQARRSGLSARMRDAGQAVGRNQIGQAGQAQAQALEQLQEMLDILMNRREQELSRLVKKLREAEQQLAALREKQAGLRKKVDEAQKIPDEDERRRELERLSREQRALQEEAQRFARRLERLQAEQASRQVGRASASMGQAGEAGQQGDAAGASGQAGQAEKDLEEAQQALAQRRRQAEADLANEELARLEDSLKGLVERQRQIVAETKQYDALRAAQQGRFTRSQSISVRDLARQQQTLRDETGLQAEKLEAAAAFKFALDLAARQMDRVVAQLAAQDTGPGTQQAAELALRRLEQLLGAMTAQAARKPGEQPEGEQGGQQGGQGRQPSLAELRLAKLLQEDLNLRTRTLAEQLAAEPNPSPDQVAELQALSQEQGQLADLILNLSEPVEADPESDPDALPEMERPAPDEPPAPEKRPSTPAEVPAP